MLSLFRWRNWRVNRGCCCRSVRRIVIYCAVGERSAIAAAALLDAGYTNVSHWPAGSSGGWRLASRLCPTQDSTKQRDVATPATSCFPESACRASRSSSMPGSLWWEQGGLGSPAALYLAAAGIGTIGLVVCRRRRDIQSATPDHPHHRRRRTAQDCLSNPTPYPGEPRHKHPTPPGSPHRRQCSRNHGGVRHRPRRHRQLRHSLPDQRRFYASAGSSRAWLGIPVRGPGCGLLKPYETACYRCLFPKPPPSDHSAQLR